MGDIDSTAVNRLKEKVFQGNEEAYDSAEDIFAFLASAFVPIGKASSVGNLSFRSGSIAVAKEGISALAGEGASHMTTELTGNRTVGMIAGMLASGTTAHGLNQADVRLHVSGNKGGSKTISQLLKKTTCSNDELYVYLSKQVDSNLAAAFVKNGRWPSEVQIPKNSSALNPDGSINWSKAPQGGYTLDVNGNAIKEKFIPKIGNVIDRYGPANGRYTSPVIDGKTFGYSERTLPYVEDASKYHQYKVTGDFAKIKEYVKNCTNNELKAKIDAAVTAYYDGDYSKLVSYKGKAVGIEGWGKGGAIQYEFSLTIEQLEGLGLLKEIK